jgi:SSS family solute:Na+ symporter
MGKTGGSPFLSLFFSPRTNAMLLSFIGLYLLVTLGIGWWASTKVHNTQDFVIAGRHLPMVVAASALFATWFGSETIMGASSEFVEHGLLGVIEDPFGAALCLILVGMFFARPLYRLKILTFNDFYRMRYNRVTEFLSALLMVPSYFSWIAAQLVAMAILLKALVGTSLFWGILTCTLIVVFYTYIGGMWAVSVTDSVQTVMIMAGMIYLASILVKEVGGIGVVLQSTPEGFFRFFPDRDLESITHYISAWITLGLGSIPAQDVFQRVLSARSERSAMHASYLSGIMYLTVGIIPLFIGLCGKALYPEYLAGDTQMVIPNMVLEHGTILLQVLFFGALLSAILSTTSGAILAPATVIGENLIRPYLKRLEDWQLLRIMRFSVVGVAGCSAIIAGMEGNIYNLVGLSSAFTLVSLFVPLTAGLYWKRASVTGALFAIVGGMTVWITCILVETIVPPAIYGALASSGMMLLGSYLRPDGSYRRFLSETGIEA